MKANFVIAFLPFLLFGNKSKEWFRNPPDEKKNSTHSQDREEVSCNEESCDKDCSKEESRDKDCIEEECCIEECCYNFLDGFNLYSFYSFGKSVGICENYGSTGIFYSQCLCPCDFGFIFDAAFHYFDDDNTFGASVGPGIRFADENDCFVGGLSLYYDYREGENGHFHQIGPSLEILGNCFEFRANGYFPLAEQIKNSSIKIFDNYDNTGVSIPYEASAFKKEFAMTGFDAEGGITYCCQSFTVFAGVGPYYFERSSLVDFWGVKGRLRVEYGQIIAMEGQVTWDDFNKREGRVRLEINIPFTLFCDLCKVLCCPCKSQKRVYRDSPIHIQRCCFYKTNF